MDGTKDHLFDQGRRPYIQLHASEPALEVFSAAWNIASCEWGADYHVGLGVAQSSHSHCTGVPVEWFLRAQRPGADANKRVYRVSRCGMYRSASLPTLSSEVAFALRGSFKPSRETPGAPSITR